MAVKRIISDVKAWIARYYEVSSEGRLKEEPVIHRFPIFPRSQIAAILKVADKDIDRLYKLIHEDVNLRKSFISAIFDPLFEIASRQPIKLTDAAFSLVRHRLNGAVGWLWLYKNAIYEGRGSFSTAEQELLVLEANDMERKKFERLKLKYDSEAVREVRHARSRIPEEVRIAVWQRDQGQCARCHSRDRLEYDHIVPVSKGGSNTVRNVELLCEKCNREKGSQIL